MKKVLCDSRYMQETTPIKGACELLAAMTPVEYVENLMGVISKRAAVPGNDMREVADGMETNGLGMVLANQAALIPYMVAAINELNARLDANQTSAEVVVKPRKTKTSKA